MEPAAIALCMRQRQRQVAAHRLALFEQGLRGLFAEHMDIAEGSLLHLGAEGARRELLVALLPAVEFGRGGLHVVRDEAAQAARGP